MQSIFKLKLDNIELESIIKFCNSTEYFSIEQSPGWFELCYNTKLRHFYVIEGNEILSYCRISEAYGSAQIQFGPVSRDKNAMITAINEIIGYYKKKHYYYLGIQMYLKSGYNVDFIEYALNKLHRIRYIFDSDNTKSSIEINLKDDVETILSNIRKGHKSDIKKASKLGLQVYPVKNSRDLDSFIEVYSKMCRFRKINEGDITKENIYRIHDYLVDNNKGFVLLLKDAEGIIIGGAIFVYQGITVRFLKGATDPDRRELPMLHILMFEAIMRAKKDNFTYFDFWGYNHFADEKNPVYFINHFKKGFGGYFTFFAKKMNISLYPGGYFLYKFLIKIKGVVKKLGTLIKR